MQRLKVMAGPPLRMATLTMGIYDNSNSIKGTTRMRKSVSFVHKALFATTAALISQMAAAQDIPAGALGFSPVLDGDISEWSGASASTVSLVKTMPGGKSNIASVELKAGVAGDNFCIAAKWPDDSEDNQHKPYVWDDAAGKYVAGSQREDRFAIQFAMEGDYDTNWMSGNEFTADTWHWKAARSNPAGLAHDKSTKVSQTKMKKSYSGTAENGSTIYIRRPSDAGDKLYKTKRYATKAEAVMPKYILAENPQGSIADVKAKGVWKDGYWTLEACRSLNTGNADDVVFTPGQAVKGGIAIFDKSGDADHNHSAVLNFQL